MTRRMIHQLTSWSTKWMLALCLFCSVIAFSEYSRYSYDDVRFFCPTEESVVIEKSDVGCEQSLVFFLKVAIPHSFGIYKIGNWKNYLDSFDRQVHILLKIHEGNNNEPFPIFKPYSMVRSSLHGDDDDKISETIG